MKPGQYQVTEVVHHVLSSYVQPGNICVDATCGNGVDTLFLAEKVGKEGCVYGFDIQKKAIEETNYRLESADQRTQVVLFCAGHETMKEQLLERDGEIAGHVAAAIFNFGYLSGGDYAIHTRAETSIKAMSQCQELLAVGGIMALCIYSGGDTGHEEKEAVLQYLEQLDQKRWLVLKLEYFNRGNNPPIPVFAIKLR